MPSRCATRTCGTPLEARWFCPTCAVAVDDPDAAESPSL